MEANEYEAQREARITKNYEKLRDLVNDSLQRTIETVYAAENEGKENANARRRVRVPTRKRVRGRKKPVAVRKSRRVRGVDPSTSDDPHPVEDPDDPEEAKLLTCDEYYAVRGMDATPVRSEGFFTGWVNDEVRARYGIADDPDKAWNENGGGQFTFKISKKDIQAQFRGRGWSDAKAVSAGLMLKNPNAYFYRHVAPHETQAQGNWTEEEHSAFLETARKYGVGTKWGLFASHVKTRVGYQCSAYYREVMLPEGLIADPRFRLTATGRTHYVG